MKDAVRGEDELARGEGVNGKEEVARGELLCGKEEEEGVKVGNGGVELERGVDRRFCLTCSFSMGTMGCISWVVLVSEFL